jgi:hypothetical protein
VLTLWSAQLLSVLGDRFFALAIMWLALERSGPVAMGLVAIFESVPYIVMSTTGRRLVARWASYRALAGVDLVRAALTAGLPWLWAAGGTSAMLAVVLALGAAGSVFDPALGSLVPELVDKPLVPKVTAAMDLTGRIARVAGPALAGVVLLAAPQNALFIADAASFGISTVALLILARIAPVPALGDSPQAGADASTEPVAVRSLLRQHPTLGAALAVHAIGTFLGAIPAIGLPLLLARHLHADSSAYGLVLTASGVGALAGNLLLSNASVGTRFPGWFCAGWLGTGVLMTATALSSNLGWVVAFSAVSGLVSPFIGVTLSTHLSGFDPAPRLGLMQFNFGLMRTAGTAGMAVLPAAIADVPTAGFVVGGSALAAAAGAAWLLSPALAVRAPEVAEEPLESPATPYA